MRIEPAGYEFDGDTVRFRGWELDRVDLASFMPLAWSWATDRSRVYYRGVAVTDADPASFVPHDAWFGRDRARVFAGHRGLEADVASFRPLGAGYASDDSYVYFGELRLGYLVACWTVETADPATFRVLAHTWGVDRTHVYCAGEVVPDATLDLTPLTRVFGRDRTRVFARRRTIEPADPATFRPLGEHHAIDARHVYHADISWRMINSPFHSTSTVPSVVDRASFRSLSDDFAVDANHFYWHNDIVVGIEPHTARVLSPSFVCDHERVYYFYRGIHRTELTDGVYRGIRPIVLEGADPRTFRDLGALHGADAARAYYHSTGIALRGSATRLEVLDAALARDDVAVYFEGEAFEGISPATFSVIAPGGIARDGERWYGYDAHGEYPMMSEISHAQARARLDGGVDLDADDHE